MLTPKQSVKDTAKRNFESYSDDWVKGRYDTEEESGLSEYAKELFQERNDLEVERDKKDGITEADYIKFVEDAWNEWYYDFIEEQAGIGEDGTDGNGLSVEDILAKGKPQKIAEYLGLY